MVGQGSRHEIRDVCRFEVYPLCVEVPPRLSRSLPSSLNRYRTRYVEGSALLFLRSPCRFRVHRCRILGDVVLTTTGRLPIEGYLSTSNDIVQIWVRSLDRPSSPWLSLADMAFGRRQNCDDELGIDISTSPISPA